MESPSGVAKTPELPSGGGFGWVGRAAVHRRAAAGVGSRPGRAERKFWVSAMRSLIKIAFWQ